MALSEQDFLTEELHPIDVVEHVAEHHEWEFDRVADDQIAMAVEGQWRTYSITLAWSNYDETLRMVCSFEMEPPAERESELYELLIELHFPLGRWFHFERTHHPQRFVIVGPGEGDRIRPPLALDSHGDLIVPNAVKIPVVMFGQMFNNVDRMNVFFEILLGKGHNATSLISSILGLAAPQR